MYRRQKPPSKVFDKKTFSQNFAKFTGTIGIVSLLDDVSGIK